MVYQWFEIFCTTKRQATFLLTEMQKSNFSMIYNDLKQFLLFIQYIIATFLLKPPNQTTT